MTIEYPIDSLVKQAIDNVETRFVRAGYLVIQERNSSNSVTSSYVWDSVSPGGIGGLLELTQGGAHYDYLYDGKGNVTALTDANQQVVAAYRYDGFGVLKAKSGTLVQPYQFSTKRYYAALGLVKYEYRDYLPAFGKWAERDPMGEEGGINLYVMVLNNPLNLVDPFGMTGFDNYATITNYEKPRSGVFTVQFGAAVGVYSFYRGFFDSTPYMDFNSPQLGFGVTISYTRCPDKNGNKDDSIASTPIVYTAGLGKYMGLSFADDFSSFTLGVGFGVNWPPIPVTISLPGGALVKW